MTLKRKIFEVKIVREVDTDPDTSWLGEYTDKIEDGVIVRRFDEFYERLPRDEEGDLVNELPERGNEYRAFKPYAGGEKVGAKEYYEYGMQDYERMESLNNEQWCFVGVTAKAKVGISFDGGKTFKLDSIQSAGLWGIESDSDKSYFDEVAGEQLSELKDLLVAYGFGRSAVAKAIKQAELVDE